MLKLPISPVKTGEYPRIFPNCQNCARLEKDLKDNKHDSLHLGRKYARIFVLRHYLFLEGHSFPRATLSQSCSLLGTCNFRRLRDELVGNYYSDGTLERRAVHLGLLKDYLRFLARDLSHSRSVSRSVRPLYFLRTRFDLICSCKLIEECPFLGVSCCCIR